MKKFQIVLALFISTIYLTAQEKQVTFDATGKVKSIDAVMAGKINYFGEYEGFREAYLYQQNDSSFVLEIVTVKNKEIYRTRKNLTASEAEHMRADVSAKLSAFSPKSLLNQEGRTLLLLMNSVVNYGFYGMALSTMITDDFSPAVYFLSSGAGFIAPLLMTRDKEVTLGQGIMTAYGQTRGILHGMLLPVMFSSEPDYRVTLGFGIAGSITEALMGYKWAGSRDFNDGQVSTIALFSDFGMALGLGATHAMGMYDKDYVLRPNLLATSVLAGAAGGLILGNSLAGKDYYSQGDVAISGSLAALGAYLPLALLSIIEPDNPRWYTAAGTIGVVGGLYAGDLLAKKYDFSNRQSLFSTLSMFGGGLIGAGIGHAIVAGNNDEWYDYDHTWPVVLSAIGAATGLGLALKSYTKDINKENQNLSLRMQMNPLGFMNSRLTAGDPTGRTAIPIVIGKIVF